MKLLEDLEKVVKDTERLRKAEPEAKAEREKKAGLEGR